MDLITQHWYEFLQRGRAETIAGFFFFQAEDGIRDRDVTGVQTCGLPISHALDESRNQFEFSFPADCRRHVGVSNSEQGYGFAVVSLANARPMRLKPSANISVFTPIPMRSEERRVGKEGKTWRSTYT